MNIIFNDVTEIIWRAGELNKKVIKNFPNLQILYCENNKITSLEPLSTCVNLQVLYCSMNEITSLEPLSSCVSLKQLECYLNQIKSLEPLSNCTNLQKINITRNPITSLEPLSNCINIFDLRCCFNSITSLDPLSKYTNLKIFFCNNNEITSLEPLSNCLSLEMLFCQHNQIKSLKTMKKCINLRLLDCRNNQISSLKALSNCESLRTLIFDNNKITSLKPLSNCTNLEMLLFGNNQVALLDPLIQLVRLNYLDYQGNPIEIPTIQIQRMLNRINSKCGMSIYDDNQNIHDTEIQRTVCESVQSLLKDPKNDFTIEDIINSGLNKTTIEYLVEYCQDQTVHSIHLITYHELLELIWNRIQNSIHKSELMKILEEQIADSECKCFTGRFNRTLSVLVGFFDDIQINISNKSRISAIILNSKDKIFPYNPIEHKDLATKELIDAGYVEADFKDWIDAIDE